MNQDQIDSMIAHYTKLRMQNRISDYTFDRVMEEIRAELLHQKKLNDAFVTLKDAEKLRRLGLTVHDC